MKTAVDQLIDSFKTNPANYTVEIELAADLKNRLNGRFPEIDARGRHDSGRSQGAIPDHSLYADRICAPTTINPAHCEVNVRDFQAPDTVRLLDVVVFDDEVTFELAGGTKRFRAADIRGAAEVKYVKNIHYLRPSSKKYDDIETDIARLDKLPNADERHMLVFGNFNLARRSDGEDAFHELASFSSDVDVSHVFPGGKYSP